MPVTAEIHGLADDLEATSAHLGSLWRQAEDRGLHDAVDWHRALAAIEETAAAVAQFDPDIAAQIDEALGWLRTGDGSPSLPEDFYAGLDRVREAVYRLRVPDGSQMVRSEPAQERRKPALSISQAAARCGVSRTTVRRRLNAGSFPHAWREDRREAPGSGPWQIPVTDLIAAGLDVHATDRPEQSQETVRGLSHDTTQDSPEPTGELVGRLGEMERERDEWRRRAEVAEARAQERQAHIEDLRMALRQLEAQTGPTPNGPEPSIE